LPPEATGSIDADADADADDDDDADVDADADVDDDASAHRCTCTPNKLDETLPRTRQQLQLPLSDLGNGLDAGDVGAAFAQDPSPSPSDALSDLPAVRPRRLSWASLLMRSLGVDGLQCPRCQSQMVLLALISAPRVVAKILAHLRLPSSPPPLAPARQRAEPEPRMFCDDLDQTHPFDADAPEPAASELSGATATPRGPP
jgi:hypothetical protein